MRTRIDIQIFRTITVALLGAAVAVLVSCGSSGTGLIPSSNAGPLQSDFEAVAQAATSGNGSCEATESALGKTEQDFLSLPVSVDRGLHKRLQEGISNLRKQALSTCTKTTTPTTTTTTGTTGATGTTTTTTPTTSTETNTTPTAPTTPAETTPTTPTTPANRGGGTEAPGESEEGASKDKGESESNGGANAGGASAGSGQ